MCRTPELTCVLWGANVYILQKILVCLLTPHKNASLLHSGCVAVTSCLDLVTMRLVTMPLTTLKPISARKLATLFNSMNWLANELVNASNLT